MTQLITLYFALDFATLNWPHFDHHIWPHPNR